jgi:hypothetical protein
VLKHVDTFVLVDHCGDIEPGGLGEEVGRKRTASVRHTTSDPTGKEQCRRQREYAG